MVKQQAAAVQELVKPIIELVRKRLNSIALTVLLAYALTCTSSSTIGNLPVAAALLALFSWLASAAALRRRPAPGHANPGHASVHEAAPHRLRGALHHGLQQQQQQQQQQPLSQGERDAWRRRVRSKVVEYAWEKLCGSIVQQWVYSTWYAALTPDRELPAEVRHMLNTAFGELASRAARVDVKELLIRDVCQVLVDNIELYRATRDAVGIEQLAALAPAARERALQREMRAMGNLHVAMCTPGGHYKFLRSMADGLLKQLLPGPAGELLHLRLGALLRELCAACMLRPIMMYCLPHSINKLLLNALQDEPPAPKDPAVERLLVEAAQRFEQLTQSNLKAETEAMLAQEHRHRKKTSLGGAGPSSSSSPAVSAPRHTDGRGEALPEESEPSSSSSSSAHAALPSSAPVLTKAASSNSRLSTTAGAQPSTSSTEGSLASSTIRHRSQSRETPPRLQSSTSSSQLAAGGGVPRTSSVSAAGAARQQAEDPTTGNDTMLDPTAAPPAAPPPPCAPRPPSRHRATRSDVAELAWSPDAAAAAPPSSGGLIGADGPEEAGVRSRTSAPQTEQEMPGQRSGPSSCSMSSSWHASQPTLDESSALLLHMGPGQLASSCHGAIGYAAALHGGGAEGGGQRV